MKKDLKYYINVLNDAEDFDIWFDCKGSEPHYVTRAYHSYDCSYSEMALPREIAVFILMGKKLPVVD